MAEEIENIYGRETELSEKARMYLEQPKIGEWILCSERMPEKNQQIIYCDECGIVGFALYTEKNTFWDNSVEFDDVIAWMPLPDPYANKIT